jgi:hypothetical protein
MGVPYFNRTLKRCQSGTLLAEVEALMLDEGVIVAAEIVARLPGHPYIRSAIAGVRRKYGLQMRASAMQEQSAPIAREAERLLRTGIVPALARAELFRMFGRQLRIYPIVRAVSERLRAQRDVASTRPIRTTTTAMVVPTQEIRRLHLERRMPLTQIAAQLRVRYKDVVAAIGAR